MRPLDDDELDAVGEAYRRREEQKRNREAQGCHCEHGPHSEDLPDWQTFYVLREPRRDCPLHSHLVHEFEEGRSRAERERRERDLARQERDLAETRKRAVKGAVKGAFSYVFFWPAAVMAALVASFIVAIVPMIAVTAVLEFPGIAIGVIGWAALLIGLLVWFGPVFVDMLDELGVLGRDLAKNLATPARSRARQNVASVLSR